jgi:DNA polymerase III alpha subunit
MSSKKIIQTKLVFISGGLGLINDSKNESKNDSKEEILTNIKKSNDEIKNTKQIPAKLPLPESYRPPSDLNQYESLDLTIKYDTSTHLEYLPKLLDKLRHKCIEQNKDWSSIQKFYEILTLPEPSILISQFKRKIPEERIYFKRLVEEFRLIRDKKFTKVFLQVMDILKIADDLEIPHIIRGSAGSSLVCYLLRITDIDPIAEKISLARFMHIQRVDLPDIDIDFPHNRRDEIYEKIFRIYGNRVARISNHVAFSNKTAIKQAMRNAGYRKFLPKDFDIADYVEDESQIEKIMEQAEELDGQFSHYSLHCGGIIIFDKPIPQEYILESRIMNQEAPVERQINWQQVLLNKDQVDDYQFIKIDILSNRGLAELWDIDQRAIESYPTNCADTLRMLANGHNIGIVYAESRAMRKALICLQVANISDIALALAIIRPVAREHKGAYFKEYHEFMALKRDVLANQAQIHNPRLAQLNQHLGEYIVYDDDAIQYIQKLLQCTEDQADIYRKAFAKAKYPKMMEFFHKLKAKNPTYTIDKVNLIYDQLCNLTAYSFCKSHAISYAKLVYALAYQKTHQPHRFWVAALNNCNSSYRKWVYFREAAAVGIKLTRGYSPWNYDPQTKEIISNSTKKLPFGEHELDNKTNEELQVLEYFRLGYWTSQSFLSGLYLTKDSNATKIKKRIWNQEKEKFELQEVQIYYWRFAGLISNYRTCKTKKKKFTSNNFTNTNHTNHTNHSNHGKERNLTFCTLGYNNAKYVDIVLYGKINLSKCHVLEGYGVMIDESTNINWIQVNKWKPKYLNFKP